jgi:acetyl esterase/lipase
MRTRAWGGSAEKRNAGGGGRRRLAGHVDRSMGMYRGSVIFCVHGGGYVSGSIYTHRKMFGHLANAIGCHKLVFNYDYGHQNVYRR